MPADSAPRVLVTGATGFIGRRVVAALTGRGFPVRRALRSPSAAPLPEDVITGDLRDEPDWGPALSGVHAVVHLAARVHVMDASGETQLDAYRAVNVEATRRLAEAAAGAGVRTFVFLSSIKVNGEETFPGGPFTEADPPEPRDAYAVSKWEAEQVLASVAGLSVTTLRPPLVYGPGVGANFLRLITAVHRGLPLPLGRVRNRRSLIYVDNLAEYVARSVAHGGSGTYVVADAPPVSTPGLVREIARALGRPPRLVPVPVPILRLLGLLSGRSAAVQRLTTSLEVDTGKITSELGGPPMATRAEGLRETCAWFRQLRRS